MYSLISISLQGLGIFAKKSCIATTSSTFAFPFFLDRSFAENARWYRANRISIEFDLLYRWHSMIPDQFLLAGNQIPQSQYRYNNKLLETAGLETVLTAASTQKAGRIGLFNTPAFMRPAELHGLNWARSFRVEGFNAYRKRFGLPPYLSIADLSGSGPEAAAISTLYGGNVDAVEFTVGLFAEQRGPSDVLGETLTRIVAYDAFTHILTNPVLSTQVHCEATFSPLGWKIVNENATLVQLVARNTDQASAPTISLSA